MPDPSPSNAYSLKLQLLTARKILEGRGFTAHQLVAYIELIADAVTVREREARP